MIRIIIRMLVFAKYRELFCCIVTHSTGQYINQRIQYRLKQYNTVWYNIIQYHTEIQYKTIYLYRKTVIVNCNRWILVTQ